MNTSTETRGDSSLDLMRRLAQAAADRPFLYGLIAEDIERWGSLTPKDRQTALMRARRRAGVARKISSQPRLFAC